MIKRSIYIVAILISVVISEAAAQNSQVLYYMNIPQKHLLNPALRSTNTGYLGLPVISGVNLNLNNNFISFQDIFMKSATGDSLISVLHPDYDLDRFLPKIKDINSIETQAVIQLFGLGFNVGKDMNLFIDVNERLDINFALPGDIIRLGLLGNDQFINDRIELSSLRAGFMYYHEAGIGLAKNIIDKLRIGVKGKLLLGVATASLDNHSLGIAVGEDYSHTLDADIGANISAPFIYHEDKSGNIDSISFDENRFKSGKDISVSQVVKYMTSAQNLGLALDIGAEYRLLNDRLSVSASVTDLGYINWKRDAKNLKAKNEFKFDGIDLLDLYNRGISPDSLLKEIGDSLLNSFDYSNTSLPFKTALSPGITAGASYNLTKSFSVGFLSYTRFIGKQVREALTLSANINLSNALTLSMAYTAANNRYDNLGAGLAFRAGIFQFYFLSDNIPVKLNQIEFTDNGKNTKLYIPENLQTIHVRFGMNLTFGNNAKKEKDRPMFAPQDKIIPQK